jgi:molybdopterin synthase sulfur carrier subunit
MKILYFAWMRQRVGAASEELDPPASVDTVDALIDWLIARDEGHKAAFARREAVRAAVNQDYVPFDHPVAAGDEVAFFPPVTGG